MVSIVAGWDKIKKPVVPIAALASTVGAFSLPEGSGAEAGALLVSVVGIVKIIDWLVGTKEDGTSKLTGRKKAFIAVGVAFLMRTVVGGVGPIGQEMWFDACLKLAAAAAGAFSLVKAGVLNR